MNEAQENELLERVYKESYYRKQRDVEFAKTHSEAKLGGYFIRDGFLLGLKDGVKCTLPPDEAIRLLFLMEAVEWSGEDDMDEGDEMDVKGAIQRARESWEKQKAREEP